MPSHFAAVIVRRWNPKARQREQLVLDYIPKGKKGRKPAQTKYSGGDGLPGEDPRQTAARELFEETGLKIAKKNLDRLELVYVKHHGEHVQYFFRIDEEYCIGKPRLVKGSERNSKLENLRHEPVNGLYDVLHPGPHREAFTRSEMEDAVIKYPLELAA